MGKIKYISLEAIRKERDTLIQQRNNALMNQNYYLANKLLIDIQFINPIFNEALKNQ